MIFSKAPLDTMKTATVVTAIPFIVIILIQTFGFVRWLREDYSALPSYLIEKGEKSESLRLIQREKLIQGSEKIATNKHSDLIEKDEVIDSSAFIQENQKIIIDKL